MNWIDKYIKLFLTQCKTISRASSGSEWQFHNLDTGGGAELEEDYRCHHSWRFLLGVLSFLEVSWSYFSRRFPFLDITSRIVNQDTIILISCRLCKTGSMLGCLSPQVCQSKSMRCQKIPPQKKFTSWSTPFLFLQGAMQWFKIKSFWNKSDICREPVAARCPTP